MAFRTYQSLGDVLKTYRISYAQAAFPVSTTLTPAPQRLKDDLAFTQQTVYYRNSEAAVCETIIYPILKEVWRPYVTIFTIWSHQSLYLNNDLNEIPDYLLTKRSALSHIVFETPYVAVLEAKHDDGSVGWAQCVLEMHIMQQLNRSGNTVFGIVSNGDGWQIGQLTNSVFTEYSDLFTLNRLDELFSALTYVLETCRQIYNL